jgi:hypothetical protein
MRDRGDRTQPSTVVWRHWYRGRLRWAIPSLLIEETPERLVTLLTPGVVCKAPAAYDRPGTNYVQQLLQDHEEIGDFVWHSRRILKLAPVGAAHALDLHWDHATGAFLGWYVNLQEPFRVTPHGYDTFDQMLDIWIEPGGTWAWKDWDELVEAEHVGIFTAGQVADIRAEGQRVIDSLDRLLPTGWESWQPDPAWAPPALPADWPTL